MTGYIRPSAGRVTFEGKNITGKRPHYVAGRGIVRSFQQDNVFADFTALENLVLAAHLHSGVSSWQTIFKTRGSRRAEQRDPDRRRRRLSNWWASETWPDSQAGSLAHGHKRMLGIGLALMCQPKLLMLDEPLAGMNISEVDDTLALVRKTMGGRTDDPFDRAQHEGCHECV